MIWGHYYINHGALFSINDGKSSILMPKWCWKNSLKRNLTVEFDAGNSESRSILSSACDSLSVLSVSEPSSSPLPFLSCSRYNLNSAGSYPSSVPGSFNFINLCAISKRYCLGEWNWFLTVSALELPSVLSVHFLYPISGGSHGEGRIKREKMDACLLTLLCRVC